MKSLKLLSVILVLVFLFSSAASARRAFDSYNLSDEEREKILNQYRSKHKRGKSHSDYSYEDRSRKRKKVKHHAPVHKTTSSSDPIRQKTQTSQKKVPVKVEPPFQEKGKPPQVNALYVDPIRNINLQSKPSSSESGLSPLADPVPPLSIDEKKQVNSEVKKENTSKAQEK